MNFGKEEGTVCGRPGVDGEEPCPGIIEVEPIVNCICHINPPCPACVDVKLQCPECGWFNP